VLLHHDQQGFGVAAKIVAIAIVEGCFICASRSRIWRCSPRMTSVGPEVIPVADSKAGKQDFFFAQEMRLKLAGKFGEGLFPADQLPLLQASSASAKISSQCLWCWNSGWVVDIGAWLRLDRCRLCRVH
jgi:hypothetical protein